jgi:hypothetical protein
MKRQIKLFKFSLPVTSEVNKLIYLLVFLFLGGCSFGNQPLIWTKTAELNFDKGIIVEIEAKAAVPKQELNFMLSDIRNKVTEVLKGEMASVDAYTMKVTITKYDEGSSCARFMLAGLGQMYLFGTVEVLQGNPPRIIREGKFEKNYSVGGMIGYSATMRTELTSKVGKAIAEALLSKAGNM